MANDRNVKTLLMPRNQDSIHLGGCSLRLTLSVRKIIAHAVNVIPVSVKISGTR